MQFGETGFIPLVESQQENLYRRDSQLLFHWGTQCSSQITAGRTWSEGQIAFFVVWERNRNGIAPRPALNPWDHPTFSKGVHELFLLQRTTLFFTPVVSSGSWQMFHKIWLGFNSQNGVS